MKIINVSMIAVALMTAGATAAFARGGAHFGSQASDSAVNSYASAQPVASEPTITSAVQVRQYPGLDQQSAAVLRLEEAGDAASEK